MAILILGLILFLGVHSTRILAPGLRESAVRSMGLLPWKGLYSVISLVGFVLIIWGYGEARYTPTWVWVSPDWTRHITALLLLPAFILLAAAYVPGTHMKARLGHPMALGVKLWAFAHLLSNGTVADILLFGAFLAWAILYYAIARRRDRAEGVTYKAISAQRDLIAVVIGLVFYGAFAFVLHEWLIGVRPFG
ncbi:NnrU family protein, required for expression of nitric oxide and nitrite reductases (Nir and Nor) [Marinobacterium lacunae]|uniref:NnrU family protein, required for expression of nitric oxide and nitrite reductases (Nir and Nor) n=1 Tax=Marinobacterium lacunae TaxID=1232683 RepID=A0A081G1R1_9GAMM|nr:NnrU family protein [Marinobacterium lacunae]KEA64716.1 NnrU family protein, required for expression of nitric oxide and nitrite reductases (Nir and Nor) [Marinobacterium lacunae]MBR9883927.1 NnrU family protein [Oceanospirillales bacterium]